MSVFHKHTLLEEIEVVTNTEPYQAPNAPIKPKNDYIRIVPGPGAFYYRGAEPLRATEEEVAHVLDTVAKHQPVTMADIRKHSGVERFAVQRIMSRLRSSGRVHTKKRRGPHGVLLYAVGP